MWCWVAVCRLLVVERAVTNCSIQAGGWHVRDRYLHAMQEVDLHSQFAEFNLRTYNCSKQLVVPSLSQLGFSLVVVDMLG